LCRESRAEWGKIESCWWKIVNSCRGKADGARRRMGGKKKIDELLVAA